MGRKILDKGAGSWWFPLWLCLFVRMIEPERYRDRDGAKSNKHRKKQAKLYCVIKEQEMERVFGLTRDLADYFLTLQGGVIQMTHRKLVA